MVGFSSIVIIGTGKVAKSLLTLLLHKQQNIVQIFGRDEAKAKAIAAPHNISFTSDVTAISKNADLIIIAVKDSAIEAIAAGLKNHTGLIVHTAGNVASNIFSNYCKNYGVLYPLQTLNGTTDVAIPFLINANSELLQTKLLQWSKFIGHSGTVCSDAQRQQLHLAAVYANNFSNYLYHLSYTICKNNKLPFSVLKPLIANTVNNLSENDPINLQTGPAIRYDNTTITNHLNSLANYPEPYATLYQLFTKAIQEASLANK
jgi:predicted short-subunit dehydrogenase-like oxidoreductase (DUF2520 family)